MRCFMALPLHTLQPTAPTAHLEHGLQVAGAGCQQGGEGGQRALCLVQPPLQRVLLQECGVHINQVWWTQRG